MNQIDQQNVEDAKRYQWLFDARTAEQCADAKVGNEPLKIQDLAIANISVNFMCKSAVDAMIDKFMQQEAALAAVKKEQTK